MRIGIDLDGVVIDSEQTFRTFEEIFDIEHNQNKLIDREEPKFQGRYSWSLEEQMEFQKYFLEVARNSSLMPGFKKVFFLLKKLGIEFVVITARGVTPNGNFMKEMENDAKRILKRNHIHFDRYYFKQKDKLEVCLKEKVDYMIEDDYKIIEKLADNGIKTLYFRDVGLKKLEENDYIKEVNNWGDIYRFLYNEIKKEG